MVFLPKSFFYIFFCHKSLLPGSTITHIFRTRSFPLCRVQRGVRSGPGCVLLLDIRYNSHSISIFQSADAAAAPEATYVCCRASQMLPPSDAATTRNINPLLAGQGLPWACACAGAGAGAVNKTFIKILYTQHVPRLAAVFPRQTAAG